MMKKLLLSLLFGILGVGVCGQTIKSLGYNTTNGQVVYGGTNVLTFTNNIMIGEAFERVGLSSSFLSWNNNNIIGFEDNSLIGYWVAFNLEISESIIFNSTSSAATRTNLGATVLGDAIFTAANQTAARQALGLQTYANTLTNSVGTVEIGSTVNSVTVGWTVSPTNATYALRQLVRGTNTNTITNNSSTLAFTSLGLTNDTTWTLTVGDGQGVTNTATTSVLFQNYMTWGRSALTNLDNASLQSLYTSGGGASRAFATSRSRSITLDGGGQYLYIAYPQGFGAASFTVGGLPNSAWTVFTNSYTNASGYITNYLIYRTDTIQNGTGINIVVQ